MSYSFGERSLKNLGSCHIDLQLVAREALKDSQIDFGISEGHRSIERQQKLFNEGKSKIDGVNKMGKHNYSPSMAFDFYAYVAGNKKLAFDTVHLMYLVGVITATGNRLYKEERITHKIRSGANWDGDGQLKYDQSFFDAPHIEIIS